MSDENYALAEGAIRGHRAVVDDVVSTLRQAWESGDDPVLYLQGIATAYEKQAAFATGGPGAAMFTICAQMLLEARLELEGAVESIGTLQDPQGYLEGPLAIEGLAEADVEGARSVSSAELLRILERRALTSGQCFCGHDRDQVRREVMPWCPVHDPGGNLPGPRLLPLAIEGPAEPCCGSHGPMCGISSDPCCQRCLAQVGP